MTNYTHESFIRFDPLKFLPDTDRENWNALLGQNAWRLGKSSKIFHKYGWNGLLSYYLGEEQFGHKRYQLNAIKKVYYYLKPIITLLPTLHTWIKRYQIIQQNKQFPIRWPIEDRFVIFLLHCMLQANNGKFPDIWPEEKEFAFVLTHDVETERGLRNIHKLVELEKVYGFRSAFNLVPERYTIEINLIQDLINQGFEVGVHGLNHDGKLFFSSKIFNKRAIRINHYLNKWKAVGFRSPLTHRNPQWMQSLQIEYDSSFFDTDPYEPMPGGVMSIWPFFIGHFVELPYTLPQDSTLFNALGETTIDIWKKKIEWIAKNHGMAMINVHPDYIDFNAAQNSNTKTSNKFYPFHLYEEFLSYVKAKGNYWHALPKECANHWKKFDSPGVNDC